MRTQILKGASLALVLGVLALSAPAPVAAADIRANVPFSFNVNKKVLPPGKYDVSNSAAHTLLIRGFGAGAVVMSQKAEAALSSTRMLCLFSPLFRSEGRTLPPSPVGRGPQGRRLLLDHGPGHGGSRGQDDADAVLDREVGVDHVLLRDHDHVPDVEVVRRDVDRA